MVRQEFEPVPSRRLQDHSTQQARVLAPAQTPAESDRLVRHDPSVAWQRTPLHDTVAGGTLQARHKKDAGGRQLGKPQDFQIPAIEDEDGPGVEALCARDRCLAAATFCDHQDRRQIAVVVQREVQLHRPLRATKGRPRKHLGTQFDQRGIQAQQLVLKPKLPRTRDGLTPREQLVEHRLIQLPRPMLVGVGERRPGRGRDAQMRETALATGQPADDLTQRLRLPEVAEQHGDELPPARKAPCVTLRVRLFNRALKFGARKQVEQLTENAAKSHRGWPPVGVDGVWRLVPPSYRRVQPLFVSPDGFFFRDLIWTRVIGGDARRWIARVC
jgi:hypothetical protein